MLHLGLTFCFFPSRSVRMSPMPQDEFGDPQPEATQFCYFHFVMMLGSMYMGRVLTNWSIDGGGVDISQPRT